MHLKRHTYESFEKYAWKSVFAKKSRDNEAPGFYKYSKAPVPKMGKAACRHLQMHCRGLCRSDNAGVKFFRVLGYLANKC